MDPGLARDALTAGAGVLTGILSGLFGVGGAVISTPAIRALGASAAVAIGTTLPSIIPGAASGALRYRRDDLIDRRAVLSTAPAGVAAAVAGAVVAEGVPGDGHLLMLLTAALLAVAGVRMIQAVQADAPPAPESDAEAIASQASDHPPHPLRRYVAVGTVAGFLSGLLGVGGGIVMVPAFSQLLGLTVKRAIGTSLACVAVFAVAGTVTHGLEGGIDWRFGLLLAVGTIPGAQVGAALAIRADDDRLRRVVGTFLCATAAIYAAGELAAL
jgi:uncharacterized membrane protein YfcA